ncbi:MAG: N-acetylmuramoyl-L-alanine amidase CwlD [Clostridiales bacterium]|nr:N-acetylmuramoyl-L-alanine amidase CwlD [Clostridiales bacterium]
MREFFKKHKFRILTCGYLLLLFAGVGFSLRNTGEDVFSLERKIILIDPGHGGTDPGKVVSEGDKEKDINLSISLYLAEYLEQGGAGVYMTRTEDEALSDSKRTDLRQRRQLAERSEVDAYVSIHQNFYPREEVKGAQVFYPKSCDEGKALAECIQSRLIEIADESNKRVVKENNTYYMLKNAEKPSVIVECGFLSNPEENRLLNSEEYQKKIAWAVYIGIADYFAENEKV